MQSDVAKKYRRTGGEAHEEPFPVRLCVEPNCCQYYRSEPLLRSKDRLVQPSSLEFKSRSPRYLFAAVKLSPLSCFSCQAAWILCSGPDVSTTRDKPSRPSRARQESDAGCRNAVAVPTASTARKAPPCDTPLAARSPRCLRNEDRLFALAVNDGDENADDHHDQQRCRQGEQDKDELKRPLVTLECAHQVISARPHDRNNQREQQQGPRAKSRLPRRRNLWIFPVFRRNHRLFGL